MSEKKKIQIRYHGNAPHIEKIAVGDFIDLKAAKDIYMRKGEFTLIPLGVSMKLPEGYFAQVFPRSSTFKKYGIVMANSVGIIDHSYCGDDDQWMFPAYCVRGTDINEDYTVIRKGDRICQFCIVRQQPEIEFEEVETLGTENRGGFGSTGA